jgi:hypothetical protein
LLPPEGGTRPTGAETGGSVWDQPGQGTARLLGLTRTEEPGQGTARLLGLPGASMSSAQELARARTGEVGAAETTVPRTLEQRWKEVKDALFPDRKGVKNDIVARLAAHTDPLDRAEEAQKLWNERGGENAKSAVVPRLEEMYKELTNGQDIRTPLERPAGWTPEGQDAARVQGRIEGLTDKQLEDYARRIQVGMEFNGGEEMYAQLRAIAKEQRRRANENSQKRAGAESEPAPSEARPEDARSTEQVRTQAEEGNAAPKDEGKAPVVPTVSEASAAETPAATEAPISESQRQANLLAPEGIQELRREPDGTAPAPIKGTSLKKKLLGELWDLNAHLDPTQRQQISNYAGSLTTERVAKMVRDLRQQQQEAQDAIIKGAQQQGGEQQHQRTNADGTTTAAGRGDSTKASRAGQRAWDAVADAEAEVVAAKAALDAKQQELIAARKEMSRLNYQIGQNARRAPTREQYARKNELQTRIERLITERNQLTEFYAHSDAWGRADRAENKALGGPEPTATDEYWTFTKGIDTARGPAEQIDKLFSWVTAMKALGMAEKSHLTLLKNLGGLGRFDVKRATKDAARRALDSVAPEQQARLNRYVELMNNAFKFARDMGARTREAEAEMARRLKDQMESEQRVIDEAMRGEETERDIFKRRLTAIDDRVVRGEISVEEAAKVRELYAKEFGSDQERRAKLDEEITNRLEALNAKMFKLGRGIAGMTDEALGARVKVNPSALSAMADLARKHDNVVVRSVAKLLASEKLTARIVQIENPDFKGARYVPETDTIEVGIGGMNSITLMHEATHALTHKLLYEAMDNITKPFASLDRKQQQGVSALRTIRDVMDSFRKQADFDDPAQRLALESEHEFVSEAINNPDIQQMLSRQGLLTRVWNAIAKTLGLKTISTEFERLMEVTPTLFGDPNRASKEVFNRNIDATEHDTGTPRGAFGMIMAAGNKLAAFSPKLAEMLYAKDRPGRLLQEGYAWLTLNHITEVMDRQITKAIAKYPQAEGPLTKLYDAFTSYRKNVSESKAFGSWLTQEGTDINARVIRLADIDRKMADKTFFMGTEASRLMIDPSLKTFEEAKQRNPQLTLEKFNSKAAVDLRAAYADIVRESERIRRTKGDAVDTPLKLYNDVLAKHRLDYTRAMAMHANNMLRLHEMPVLLGKTAAGKEYNRLDVTAVPYRKMSTTEQQQHLHKAVRDAIDANEAELARALGTTVANIDAKYAELVEAKQLPDGLDNMLSLRSGMDSLFSRYQYHERVPYMHIGRSGSYLIKFSVKGGQAEWDRVGKIVGNDRKAGGLDRAWGDPKDENRDVYLRFDNSLHWKEAEERLRPLLEEGLFTNEQGDTWASGKAVEKFRDAPDSATPQFIRIMEKKIDENPAYDTDTKRQMKNDLRDAYITQLPETHPLKASLHRDGDLGYSKDFVNTFADRLVMSKGSLVTAYTSPLMGETISGMAKALRGVERDTAPGISDVAAQMTMYTTELKARMADMSHIVSTPVIDRMRAGTAAWRLMLSPAYMLMVAYQPWQVTLPFIGKRYGMVDTAKAMARNSAKSIMILNALLKANWANPMMEGLSAFDKMGSLSALQLKFSELKGTRGESLLSPEQLEVMEHLQWTGLLNFGQANQIARLAPEERGVVKRFSDAASVFPHYIEMMNRMTAMLTAHEMSRTKGGVSLEEAKKFALQIVRDTDGDHSQANIARRLGRRGIFRGATPLAVGFQQYDFQMTELLSRAVMDVWGGTPAQRREAGKAIAGVATMTAMIAGTLGMPFVGPMVALANQILSLTGDPNDTPPDVETSYRQILESIFGGKAAEVVARGIPRALDFDMSGRSGYQDIGPFSRFLRDRRKIEDKLAEGALSFMGPAVGVAAGMWTGARAAYEGNWPKAINDALPAQVRNVAKAYRLYKYGYESQSGGNNEIPIEATPWNITMQAMGLQGSERAEQAERTFAYNTNQSLLENRRAIIRNDLYRSLDRGDFENLGNQLSNLIDFSIKHPQMQTDLQGGLKQRAQMRAVASLSGTNVLAPARQYPTLQNYQF